MAINHIRVMYKQPNNMKHQNDFANFNYYADFLDIDGSLTLKTIYEHLEKLTGFNDNEIMIIYIGQKVIPIDKFVDCDN